MNKYFNIVSSPEPSIIGVQNGVCQGNIIWKKFSKKESQREILDYFSLKKFIENNSEITSIDFEIEFVDAYKVAKMTDFFVFSPALYGISFFVSQKVVDILISFKLPLCAFIPVIIYHRDIKHRYYAFYLPSHYRERVVDFKKSIFFKKLDFHKRQEIHFRDIDEYLADRLVYAEKIYFNETFDKSLDLFALVWGSGYYISESLKIAIESEGLTGIVILEPKEPELIF